MTERKDRRHLRYQPVYREVYVRHQDPSHLKETFEMFPLDKAAVDWLADEGTHIVQKRMEYSLGYYSWQTGEIGIPSRLSEDEANHTVLHEMLHGLVPGIVYGNPLSYERYKEYDTVLDEIALPFSRDEKFMDYIKGKIPWICHPTRRRLIFPDWPIR